MSVLDGVGVTAQQLHEMAAAIESRCPGAVLVKNEVGNLSVLDDGVYVGWLDLRFGGVTWLDDDPEEEGA